MPNLIKIEPEEWSPGHHLEFTFEVTYDLDPNYGADLDGNRGVHREFVEDVNLISVSETWKGKPIREIKNKMEVLSLKRFYQEAFRRAENLDFDEED